MAAGGQVWRSTLVALVLAIGFSGAGQAAESFPVIGKPAPDFALINQQGRSVRLSQLRGKIVLLNFIYTRCTDVCPITTAALVRVQDELLRRGWWGREIVFVSVTTDPAHDTPAVFTAYAKRYRIDPAGWHLLSGAPRTVAAVHRSYGIEVRPRGRDLQDHHLPTFVIDRVGMVLGAYGINPNPDDVLSDLAHLR